MANTDFVWSRKARRALDITILVLVVLTLVRVNRPPERSVPLVQSLRIGDTLSLADAEWDVAERHIVLVLRTTCPACNAAAADYRRLSATLPRPSSRLMAIGDEPAERIRGWLADHQISADRVLTVPRLRDEGFRVTPTILIVDTNGKLSDIIEGSLSPDDWQAVAARLDGMPVVPLDRGRAVARIDQIGLQQLSNPLLLDVRSREEFRASGATGLINIPHDELETRAGAELALDRPIVIDCRRGRYARCEIAWEELFEVGARQLFILTED